MRAPLTAIVLLHLAAFGVMALNCHADLAKDRPDPSRLTEFYFWVSFGGMLGGLFNTLAAPVLFDSIVEYPLVVLLACLLFRAAAAAVIPGASRDGGSRHACSSVGGPDRGNAGRVANARAASLALQLAALSVPARAHLCAAAAVGAVRTLHGRADRRRSFVFGNAGERVLYATRTFFGVYRVSEDPAGRYHRARARDDAARHAGARAGAPR